MGIFAMLIRAGGASTIVHYRIGQGEQESTGGCSYPKSEPMKRYLGRIIA